MLIIRNFSDNESSNKAGLALGASGTGAALYFGNKKFKESAKKEYKNFLKNIAENKNKLEHAAREKWRTEAAKNDIEQLLNDNLRKKGFFGRMWDKVRGRKSEYDLHNERINLQRKINNETRKQAENEIQLVGQKAKELAKRRVKRMKALKLGGIGLAGLGATLAAHKFLNKKS